MSYQVLARKWRPQNFQEMVGQQHVLQALVHALDAQRLHHAYLFTGTRGVGKTTIGRILAKCLSCENQITSTPCGTCSACIGITEGRYSDLIEIDAASRTKVEDMRELLENVPYAPSEGRFKIYLIDEVHMLSQSSFNALLKTLEEPPEHVKFLFATTDPQKLPVTILSRCLQFNLKNMPPEGIVEHLNHILNQEAISFEDGALWSLAHAANGSMRDALSLTDQAIAYSRGQLAETAVNNMLGTVDRQQVYRLIEALINTDGKALLDEAKKLAEFSPNYENVLDSIVSALHRTAIEQVVPGSSDNALGDREKIQRYAAQLCAEDVQLFYQIALNSRQDLSISPEPRTGFEMALVRMLAFKQSPSNLQSALPQNSSQTENTSQLATEPAPAASSALPEEQEQSSQPQTTLHQQTSQADEKKNTIAEQVLEPTLEQNATPITEEESSSDGENAPPSSDERVAPAVVEPSPIAGNEGDTSFEWNSISEQIGLTGMVQNLAFNMCIDLDSKELFVESGHFKILNDNHKKLISEALDEHTDLQGPYTFLEGLQEHHETPAMWKQRIAEERQAAAIASAENDPNILLLAEIFGAKLDKSSVVAQTAN